MFLPERGTLEARKAIIIFLLDYATETPNNLSYIKDLAQNLKLSAAVTPALDFASRFLDETIGRKISIADIDDPPVLVLTLLQACYMANRVIEEIDDKIESFIGIPLTPNNLMYANIIVHEVIGDRFANRLDQNLKELVKPSTITKILIEANLSNTEIERSRSAGESLAKIKVTCYAQAHGLTIL